MNIATNKLNSIIISNVLSILYVAIFYISPVSRPRNGLNLQSDIVISHRVHLSIVITIINILITCTIIFFFYNDLNKSFIEILNSFGILINYNNLYNTIRASFKSILLISILFTGPIIEDFLFSYLNFIDNEITIRNRNGSRGIKNFFYNLFRYLNLKYKNFLIWKNFVLYTWVGKKNYLAGPITEEFVYRACIIQILVKTGGFSNSQAMKISPVFFGIAHIHKAYETLVIGSVNGNPPPSLVIIVLTSLFQFLYTSLFGLIAAFLYIQTNNIWASVFAHIFCNIMGTPSLFIKFPSPYSRLKYLLYLFSLFMGLYLFIKWRYVITNMNA